MKGVIFITAEETVKKWIYISIPILFAVGTLFHFLYDLTDKSLVTGTVAPVNESVWEHTKLLLLPIIGWWTIFYMTKGQKYKININKWFTGMLVSLLAAILSTFFVYYFYTEAFGIELLIADILILLLSDTVGQLLGYHVYKYFAGIRVFITITLAVLIVIAYAFWTVDPPCLPLFFDKAAGKYGT